MTAKDQSKMLNAGFTIIKKKDYPRPNKNSRIEIRQKTPVNRNWHTRDWNFTSVDERDFRMKQLLKDPKIVED